MKILFHRIPVMPFVSCVIRCSAPPFPCPFTRMTVQTCDPSVHSCNHSHEIMPFAHAGLYIESKSDLEAAQSFDIVSDMDMMGAHRRRSNTAQRLDRLKKERRNQAKIKVIHWKDNCYSSDLTGMSRPSLTRNLLLICFIFSPFESDR